MPDENKGAIKSRKRFLGCVYIYIPTDISVPECQEVKLFFFFLFLLLSFVSCRRDGCASVAGKD
jgi:hypothetical protein